MSIHGKLLYFTVKLWGIFFLAVLHVESQLTIFKRKHALFH